jgi:hypothetical protein
MEMSVINQIDGPIITFRDGRCPTKLTSGCGKTATFPSETLPALERILDPLCVVTRRPPVPASEKSNFMIRGADQLSFAADSNVPNPDGQG